MGNEENDQLKRQNLSAYESGSNNAKLKPLNPLMATWEPPPPSLPRIRAKPDLTIGRRYRGPSLRAAWLRQTAALLQILLQCFAGNRQLQARPRVLGAAVSTWLQFIIVSLFDIVNNFPYRWRG